MAVTSTSVEVANSYDINASDANGDALVSLLTLALTGMTVNAGNGVIV